MLPHERTLPKAKSDRLALLRATRANLDPIWGLSLATGLAGAARPSTARRSPTAIDDDGVAPRARGAIDDPSAIAAIARRRSARAPLVLADGHHRFETACTTAPSAAPPASTIPAPTRS